MARWTLHMQLRAALTGTTISSGSELSKEWQRRARWEGMVAANQRPRSIRQGHGFYEKGEPTAIRKTVMDIQAADPGYFTMPPGFIALPGRSLVRGLAAAIRDFNGDGAPDLHVARFPYPGSSG